MNYPLINNNLPFSKIKRPFLSSHSKPRQNHSHDLIGSNQHESEGSDQNSRKRLAIKRGCVIPMVIWPAFRMGQYIVNDLPYHAPQFIFEPRLKINDCNIYDRAKSIYFKYILFHINLFDNEVLFISPVNTINNFKLLKIIN